MNSKWLKLAVIVAVQFYGFPAALPAVSEDAGANKESIADKQQQIMDKLGSVAAKVRKLSVVPVRLPSSFLNMNDELKELALYPVIVHAERSRYEIDIAYTTDCGGAYACTYARFGGSDAPYQSPKGDINLRVILAAGLTGDFVADKCRLNCGEGVLKWTQGGFYYELAMKAFSQREMVEIANSAISAP